jgi:hypothetical protein
VAAIREVTLTSKQHPLLVLLGGSWLVTLFNTLRFGRLAAGLTIQPFEIRKWAKIYPFNTLYHP